MLFLCMVMLYSAFVIFMVYFGVIVLVVVVVGFVDGYFLYFEGF